MRFPYASGAGYAVLGLSANPFVAESRSGVDASLWIDRAGVPEAPEAGRRRLVQIIGPKGAGKTSLILRWRDHLPGPYHYVELGPGRWRIPPVADLTYWDEVDRLGEPVRTASLLRAAARGATVVAGTHRDLSRLARACRLQVETYEFPGLTPALLQDWAALRIAAAALPGRTPALALDESTATSICADVGPSLRDAADYLHRWAAAQARAADTTGG